MYESKIRICKTFLIFIFISQTKTWQKIVFRKSLTLKDWIFVKQQTNPKKPKSKFLAKLNLCNFVHLPWEHTFLEYPNKRHHYFVIISLGTLHLHYVCTCNVNFKIVRWLKKSGGFPDRTVLPSNCYYNIWALFHFFSS